MKILVTGANGYIGQGVVKDLLERNMSVVATDLSGEYIDKRASFIPGNLFEITEPFLRFDKPDAVLHLAWRDGFMHNSDTHLSDLPKHYNFLKEMAEAGVTKIAVMGSMHEIGLYEGCVNEHTPTNPMSLYGISKNALRQALEVLTRNNDTHFQWIRGFYIVGNAGRGNSVFAKLYEAQQRGDKVFPFTSGINKFDFLEYEEFCGQVTDVVCQNEVCGIINCCSGYPVSLKEKAEQFISDHHLTIRLEFGAFPDRVYDSGAIWGNNDKIVQIRKDQERP